MSSHCDCSIDVEKTNCLQISLMFFRHRSRMNCRKRKGIFMYKEEEEEEVSEDCSDVFDIVRDERRKGEDCSIHRLDFDLESIPRDTIDDEQHNPIRDIDTIDRHWKKRSNLKLKLMKRKTNQIHSMMEENDHFFPRLNASKGNEIHLHSTSTNTDSLRDVVS